MVGSVPTYIGEIGRIFIVRCCLIHLCKVIRYDDGPLRALQDLSQLEEYVSQNNSPHVRRKREIRLALRALDGLIVMWPFDYVRVSCVVRFILSIAY